MKLICLCDVRLNFIFFLCWKPLVPESLISCDLQYYCRLIPGFCTCEIMFESFGGFQWSIKIGFIKVLYIFCFIFSLGTICFYANASDIFALSFFNCFMLRSRNAIAFSILSLYPITVIQALLTFNNLFVHFGVLLMWIIPLSGSNKICFFLSKPYAIFPLSYCTDYHLMCNVD